jgi:hypothetical protein
MLLKRFTVGIAACSLLLGLGLATSAQAKRFSLTGGGAQSHIGNGLALPIQAAMTAMVTKTVFPAALLLPVKGVPVILGTTALPLKTAMATPMGPITKQGYQRKLQIPAAAMSKPGVQKTVGVHSANPTVYAVGTKLNYKWPSAPAVFSLGAAVGTTTVAGFGGKMVYTNTLGARFGGPAAFSIAPGLGGGLFPTSPVTIYIKINGTTPPCAHPAFAGGNSGCVAGILLAKPTGIGGIGGATSMTVMTPGAPFTTMALNVAVMKMGAVPLGTVLAKALAAHAALPTNMATSQPGPWTTGKLLISNPAAAGMGEKFTLSGKDLRTAMGNGTIQLVGGSVSARATSGANANRGWLRLVLGNAPAAAVPSMSTGGIAATVALIVLAFGYTMRRRIFA